MVSPELVMAPDVVPAAVEEAPMVSPEPTVSPTEVPYLAATIEPPSPVVVASSGPSGRAAIALANQAARSPSRADGFVGGVQVFAWSPGRVFEVWTAPLRVTTLTLGEGETLVSKAAGDTIRWQIGEVASGTGTARRTHVLLKPLERGLETNLVLTTNRRVYLLDLKSGAADAFNAAIAWDEPASSAAGAGAEEPKGADPLVTPQGPLDARYRIEPLGRRARWTPSSVFDDGARTFIAFDADLQVGEAPVLFVLAPDGEAQMVNYRQQGGLFVVDRLFDRAELRLGDRRPQVVRIHRLTGAGR
jgi:type IV secretion system protein VirB9